MTDGVHAERAPKDPGEPEPPPAGEGLREALARAADTFRDLALLFTVRGDRRWMEAMQGAEADGRAALAASAPTPSPPDDAGAPVERVEKPEERDGT